MTSVRSTFRVLLLIVVVSAGSAFGEIDASLLPGRWQGTFGSIVTDTLFRSDGTFSGTLSENGEIVWRSAGRWQLAGNTLTYEYTESSSNRVPVGQTDLDEILSLSKEKMEIKNRGAIRQYTRIADK